MRDGNNPASRLMAGYGTERVVQTRHHVTPHLFRQGQKTNSLIALLSCRSHHTVRLPPRTPAAPPLAPLLHCHRPIVGRFDLDFHTCDVWSVRSWASTTNSIATTAISSSSCWVHMFCVRQPHDTTMFGSGSAGALMATAAAAAPLQSLKRRRRESLGQEERRGQQYEDYSEGNASAKVFFLSFPSPCTTTLQLN